MQGSVPGRRRVLVRRLLIPALLLGLTAAVYEGVRDHAFVDLDDYVLIVQAPTHRAPLSPASIASALTHPYHFNWIPLTSLSLQLDAALWGTQAGPTLLTNVALHALAALLLFAALARLTGATLPSAFVAAVFAVHPLHVESVAWASQRKDVLAGVFFGLTLLAYARWVARRGAARYALLAGALALGLLSKPVCVTAPLVLLLLDLWPLGRLQGPDGRLSPRAFRRCVIEKLPLLALAAASSWATWVVQDALGATKTLERVAFDARLANAVVSYAAYLRDAFWPSGLLVDYPYPRALPAPGVLAALLAGLAAISAVAVRNARSRPELLVGWLWFLGMLAPMIGLVQVGAQARADRYTYLPLTGLAIAVGFSAARFAGADRRRRIAVSILGCATIAALAVAAHAQTRHWRDTQALFEHAIALAPDHALAHHRLALVYARAGDLEAAERHYAALFRLEPDAYRPRYEWASRLEHQGRLDEAIALYAQALALRPDYARGHGHLALALERAGRHTEALGHFERALASLPNAPDLRRGAARSLAASGRHAEAIAQQRAWLRLVPDSVGAANDLAWALATCPDAGVRAPEEALALIRFTLPRAAEDPNLLDTLAAAYAANGRYAEAVRIGTRALRGAPDPATRGAYAERLALYERGLPYIERR